jgi:hypothetical protein
MKYSARVLFTGALISNLSLIGCGNAGSGSSTSAVDPVEASVESAATVVSGVADDQAGSSYAMRTEVPKPSIWALIRPLQAYADDCTRAINAACVSGDKSATFNACDVPGTRRTFSGSVDLKFSDPACSMAVNGNTVTRTYGLSMIGARDGVYTLKSDTETDYLGASYGGGGRLTKTVAGWDMDILGRHASFSRNSHELINISVRTLSPVSISGGLNRSSRVVNGGSIQVNHNLAGFTAVFSPSNLAWSANCCHPVSGTLNVVYSGSKTGNATVTFNGCGTANVANAGGASSAIALSYCE